MKALYNNLFKVLSTVKKKKKKKRILTGIKKTKYLLACNLYVNGGERQ